MSQSALYDKTSRGCAMFYNYLEIQTLPKVFHSLFASVIYNCVSLQYRFL